MERQHSRNPIVPHPPARQDDIVLRDGRHVAWSEWGPLHVARCFSAWVQA
jgi:hypothetical protein